MLKDGQFSSATEEIEEDPVEKVNKAGDYIANDMVDLTTHLKDMTDAERKKYFEDNGLPDVKNNLSNDTYRRFLFEVVNGGSWPEMTEEFREKYGLGSKSLYIQPFVCIVKQPDNVIVFASANNSASGAWYTSLIYHREERVWYHGPAFSINAAGGGTWEGVKATMEEKGWYALR